MNQTWGSWWPKINLIGQLPMAKEEPWAHWLQARGGLQVHSQIPSDSFGDHYIFCLINFVKKCHFEVLREPHNPALGPGGPQGPGPKHHRGHAPHVGNTPAKFLPDWPRDHASRLLHSNRPPDPNGAVAYSNTYIEIEINIEWIIRSTGLFPEN